MTVRPLAQSAAFCLALGIGTAQTPPPEPKFVAYPERDILSPFRNPTDVYAPPDELWKQLRFMQAIAARKDVAKDFDKDGHEIVDDERWRIAHAEVEKIGVDPAYLAQIMRLHRHAGERAVAFYAMFWCHGTADVFNLIAHIPGEPERSTREAAMPRAIAYLRANLDRKFGDLTPEQRDAITKGMPQIGSPAARAKGLQRLPVEGDHLFEIRLTPFFQLLDLDEPLDQAQGLWFLKEVFLIRRDQASLWLEPALPRVKQLLASKDGNVRAQAIGLLTAVGPKKQRAAPTDDPAALQAWADEAAKELFPPIRHVNDAIVQLHPSSERDAIVAAGVKALESSSLGDPTSGQRKDGKPYRGYRLAVVPDELKTLAIPAGATITMVNGVEVGNAAELLRTLRQQLDGPAAKKSLFVEYVRDGELHAVEYRIR